MVSRPVRRFRRVSTLALLAAVAGALLALAPAPAAAAPSPTACENRTNTTYDMLLECVTLEGVRAHQAAFQAIADANGGTRAAGTDGYDASVDYVVDTLEAAGWSVDLNFFNFTVVQPVQQLTPTAVTHAAGGVTGSALGTVTNAVTPIDINLIPPRANTSGCDGAFTEAAVGAPLTSDPGGVNDFAGFVAGRIALIQRGGCSFALKVANAQTAGAAAVILFNQGDTPARSVTLTNITAVPPPGSAFTTINVPLVGVSFAAGESLSQAGTTARVAVVNDPQANVIAELAGRTDDNVVMAGGHLDSVPAGPGINDNGSGSAALLEVAQQIAKVKPENTLRFAWWGGEEAGLIGSTAYVNGLSQAERDRIALYLNFDMVGSPNYIQMVYDADQSSFPPPAGVPIPAGSAAIEDVFESYYTMIGEPYDDTQFSGRSDYQGFIVNGIPSGGLFTGAEGRKTAEQQAIWGGTTGAQFDPCYHLACDTFVNVNDHALDVNSDSTAFATLTFAFSTEAVNGVPGRAVPGTSFSLPAPAGPEGTFIP
ncbi:MAG: M20/M25/M40 family metallo-hydrolase [Gaiellaceae bacterium]